MSDLPDRVPTATVTITANKGTGSSGNIGSIVNPVTNFDPTANQVGFIVGNAINGTPAQLALASAELSDLNFLLTIPVAVYVNFSGDTMTLSDGTDWSSIALTGTNGTTNLATVVQNALANNSSVYLFVGGSTLNATQNGAYLQIASISGSTITLAGPGTSRPSTPPGSIRSRPRSRFSKSASSPEDRGHRRTS